MEINAKKNVFLISIAVMVFLFYSDWKRTQSRDKSFLFPPLKTELIQHIEINSGHGAVLKLIKEDDGKWYEQEPYKTKADDKVINEVVRTLTTVKVPMKVVENPQLDDLYRYGIKNPTGEITFWYKDKKYSCTLGAKTQLPDVYYAQSSEERSIFVIESREVALWQKEANYYRDITPLGRKVKEAWRIQVKNTQGESFELHKYKDGYMYHRLQGEEFQKQGIDLAKEGRVWVFQIALLRASRLESKGEDENQQRLGSIKIWLQDKEEPQELEIYQSEEGIWSRNSKGEGILVYDTDRIKELLQPKFSKIIHKIMTKDADKE